MPTPAKLQRVHQKSSVCMVYKDSKMMQQYSPLHSTKKVLRHLSYEEHKVMAYTHQRFFTLFMSRHVLHLLVCSIFISSFLNKEMTLQITQWCQCRSDLELRNPQQQWFLHVKDSSLCNDCVAHRTSQRRGSRASGAATQQRRQPRDTVAKTINSPLTLSQMYR